MTEDDESKKQIRKLRIAWREEPLCPHCHEEIPDATNGSGNLEWWKDISECHTCGEPLQVRSRTRTEYLVLS